MNLLLIYAYLKMQFLQMFWPTIRFRKLTPLATLPSKAYSSAGYDLYSIGPHTILPGETIKIPLGIAAEFPTGLVALLWDRSSMGAKGIHRHGGVIDSDYRGEWAVCLHNTTDKPYVVNMGDKVAQFVLQPAFHAAIVEVDQLSNSARGQGGFGSTGR